MRIAVFGGSFDPVHIEHTRLAQAAIERLGLDKLFVMPAHRPPHKPNKILSSDPDRLETCRLAFAHIPKVEISDYEISQGGTSYTYLTCGHFRELYPDAEIFWLVGTDMLRDFPTWRQPEAILENVELAVCGRNEDGAGEWIEREQAAFYARFSKRFVTVGYNGADVSSTRLRVLAGAGESLEKYVPEKAAAYIRAKRLYAIPNAAEALALETPERKAHSLRVAELAAARALTLGIPERSAIEAALFHDCAKNLPADSPYSEGFMRERAWGDIPRAVLHQYVGAYVAERKFGVRDDAVLDAIRYHTSGKPNMTELGKLIFLADMLEPERSYEGVEGLRKLFWQGKDLDGCLAEALFETLVFLEKKGGEIYPLTKAAYDFYADKRPVKEDGGEYGKSNE